MDGGQLRTADFNPFNYLSRSPEEIPNHERSLQKFLRKVPNHWIGLVVGPLMAALLVAVNAAQHTLGSTEDVRLVEDVLVIMGAREPVRDTPNFPLARDFASWVLLAMIISGTILLHKEWQLMSTCLSRLIESGALIPKSVRTREDPDRGEVMDFKQTFRLSLASRLLGIDQMISGCTVETALQTLVTTVNSFLARWRLLLLISSGCVAFLFGLLLVLGQRRSIFVTFAPDFGDTADSDREMALWLDSAYSSWWASVDHDAGYRLYVGFAAVAFFIIISFNLVGFVALYLAISLRYVCRPSADWLNRDGRYGWRALAEVYRTVILAVAILGLALTVTLATLGVRNFGWVGFVVVLYIALAPAFIMVPRFLFRKVPNTAKKDRIEALSDTITAEDTNDLSRLEHLSVVVAEIERCRSAKIQPLRLRGASTTLFGFIVLPILLAALQTFFPWLTGS